MAAATRFEFQADTRDAQRGTEALERDLAGLRREQERVGRSAGSASRGLTGVGTSAGSASAGLATAGTSAQGAAVGLRTAGAAAGALVASLGLVTAAVGALVVALKPLADSFEANAAILNRFGGSVEETKRQINGLISEMDLIVAQAKILEAGLDITDEQFAAVAKAAIDFASATGQDANQALNTLSESIAAARTGPLKRLGVDLEGITSTEEKQAEAVRQLVDAYGDLEVSADTTAGKLAVFQNLLEDIGLDFLDVFRNADLFGDELGELGIAAEDVREAFATSFTGVAAIVSSVTQELTSRLATVVQASQKVVELLRQGEFTAAATVAANAAQALDGLGFVTGVARRFDENASQIFSGLGQRGQGRPDENRPGRRGRRRDDDAGGAAAAAAAAEAPDVDKTPDKVSIIDQTITVRVEGAETLDVANQTLADLNAQYDALLDKKRAEREAQVASNLLLQDAQSIATQFFSILIDGEGNIGQRLKAVAKQELIRIATRSFGQGIEATAQGISFASDPVLFPFAPGKFASAAKFFSIGALAGVGAVGVSRIGGGGGSSARPGGSETARGLTGPTSGPGNTRSPIIINYNDPLIDYEIERRNARARRALEDQFGEAA